MFWKSWENLFRLRIDQFPKSHANLLRKGKGTATISSCNLVAKLPKPVTDLHKNFFDSMFRWCSTFKDHNLLCVSPYSRGEKNLKIHLLILPSFYQSGRQAHLTVLSYLTTFGGKKKMQHIEILFPNRKTEFWKNPNFLPLYWSENDIMTWWSQLPNTSEADFRSSRWHYSEFLITLILPADSTALKKCYFPYEILLLTTVIFPQQKGYMLRDDIRQIGFGLICLHASNKINIWH